LKTLKSLKKLLSYYWWALNKKKEAKTRRSKENLCEKQKKPIGVSANKVFIGNFSPSIKHYCISCNSEYVRLKSYNMIVECLSCKKEVSLEMYNDITGRGIITEDKQ
jgi:hypothetical protein